MEVEVHCSAMSEAVPGAKSSIGNWVFLGQILQGLLEGIVELGRSVGDEGLHRVWGGALFAGGIYAEQAGFSDGEVGVFGLLVSLGDAQVQGNVGGYPG